MNQDFEMKTIIGFIQSNSTIKKFKYYKSFFYKWKELLNKTSKSDLFYLANNTTDNDQAYVYNYMLFNKTITFSFSIPYIKRFYELDKDNKLFPEVNIINNNKHLYLENYTCFYDYCEEIDESVFFNTNDVIFIGPIPTTPLSYTVLDGNHRVSSMVNADVPIIKSKLCIPDVLIKSLATPFQIAAYCCLFDIRIIECNLGEYPDLLIKKQLYIFNSESFVNNLDKR